MVGMDVGLEEKLPCNAHDCLLFYGHSFRQALLSWGFYADYFPQAMPMRCEKMLSGGTASQPSGSGPSCCSNLPVPMGSL